MSDGNVRTIEVAGQKFEVDLRTAKKIEQYRVGDKVKILTKDYSGWKTNPGIIAGIDAFQNLPTIVVAYIENPLSYSGSGGEIKFGYLNAESKDIELCPMAEDDVMPNRQTIIGYFDRATAVKQRELAEIAERRDYFVRQYGTAFGVSAADMPAATA